MSWEKDQPRSRRLVAAQRVVGGELTRGVVRGTGRLGHQRPDAHVTGLVGELRQLLVDDRKFVAQVSQAGAGLLQTSFDQPIAHRRSL